MNKSFFEVFPSLQVFQSLHDVLEHVEVEKVSADKRKTFLKIYIYSTKLIQKKDIRVLEREIKKQLFASTPIAIHIHERFALSAQYTPDALLDAYRDSILEELRDYNHMEYSAFKKAEITFPEETKILLNLEDSVLTRSLEEDLLRVLDKVINERFGLGVTMTVEYRQVTEEKFAREDEQRIRLKVAEIEKRLGRDGETPGRTQRRNLQRKNNRNMPRKPKKRRNRRKPEVHPPLKAKRVGSSGRREAFPKMILIIVP